MFAIESQGPWNGCCSLKHLKPGGFLGHPASFNWYPFVPGMNKPIPVMQRPHHRPSRNATGRQPDVAAPSHRPGHITLYAGYPKQ